MSRDSVVKICQATIRWSFILLFFLVPLVLTPYNYELFEYNKMMLTYGLTAIIIGSFLIKSVVSGKIEIQRTPFDIPLMLFLLSQIFSTIFSIDKHTSLFGYYSRFHGGLFSTISYISLFYLMVSEFKKEISFIYKCIYVMLASGFLVSIYAILQRMGVDKNIWVQDVQNRVFSTLGQPNWLATYLSVLILISIILFLKEKTLKKIIFIVLTITFYTVSIFTKSRSGFAGFWSGFAILALLSSPRRTLKYLVAVFLLIMLTSFVYGTPFSQLYPFTLEGIQNQLKTSKAPPAPQPQTAPVQTGSMIEFGGTESGSIRRIVWKGAIDVFKHYPVFGSGVETFAYSYYQFRPQAHNLTSEWDYLYNKAHNEYLNFAATTGIFGISTYLLLIVAFLFWTIKKFLKNPSDHLVLLGLVGAYTSIMVSNFFGFSVVVIGLFFFILPAFAVILGDADNKPLTISLLSSNHKFLTTTQKIIALLLLTVIVYLLFVLTRMWRADKYFNLGHQFDRENQYIQAYTNLKKAVTLDNNEPIFKEELAQVASTLSVVAARENETELSSKLKSEALNLSDILVKDYPKNVNFFKTRTRILYTLSELDQDLLRETLNTILKAWELAPNDTKIAYNVGLIYAKLGDNDQAIETLKKSSALKPDYYEPRFALALFYEQIGEKEKAIEELNFILKNIRPDDKPTQEKLKELAL